MFPGHVCILLSPADSIIDELVMSRLAVGWLIRTLGLWGKLSDQPGSYNITRDFITCTRDWIGNWVC
jgi:uncharacterized membrane protein